MLKTTWFLGALLSVLSIYLISAAFTLGMDDSQVVHLFYPMQARYIDFLGLTHPVGSFFFWVLLVTVGICVWLRNADKGWLRLLLPLAVIVFGGTGMLLVSYQKPETGRFLVDFPTQGQLYMDKDSVYRIQGNEKAILKLTDMGPLLLKQKNGHIQAFLPSVQGENNVKIRLCSPKKLTGTTGKGLAAAGILALLALVVIDRRKVL